MAYSVEPIDVTKPAKERVIDPRYKKQNQDSPFSWWLAQNDNDLCAQVLSTTGYLERTNKQRIRQASVFTRLYNGKPLYNFLSSNSTLDTSNQLPIGRPTANVTYSCIDTLHSRITQDRPQPVFQTDAGSYKEQRMADQANQFIQGEFYRTKYYNKSALMARDGFILGDGLIKIFPQEDKVCAERVIETEILTDYNDAYYGDPKQLIQKKLIDRGVFLQLFPDKADMILSATHGNVDSTPRSAETVSDQFIISEAWHLPSAKGAKDGRHVIACSAGIILDEVWRRDKFPFVRMGFNPGVVGINSQGLAEILFPTQMELYRTLIVASQGIELMSVPRVLVEEMSAILETAFNNRIGSIIKYRNTPPEFVSAQANHPEVYQYIQWLITNAYQISGISALSAGGEKPAGLNSGEAIREYDGVQDTRFSALSKRYQDTFTDASHHFIDVATEIVEKTGKYTTVYPGKDGLHEVDFKSIGLLKDTYVIQLSEESSLPKDPAGRQAKLSEMLAANEISLQEFRRMSSNPDLKQSDQLANALENRILYCLDQIIEDGKKGYIPPDRFMLDPTNMATTLAVQTINKYAVTDLEESKMNLLRQWFTQVQSIQAQVAQEQANQQMQQAQAAQAQAAQAQAAQGQGQIPVQPPQPSVAPTSNVQV